MKFIKKIINFYFREYKVNLSGIHDILTNITFFFISIFIFIFSVGPEKETLSLLGVGILWTLLLLSSTLSLRKFYQDDFENGSLIVLHSCNNLTASIVKNNCPDILSERVGNGSYKSLY